LDPGQEVTIVALPQVDVSEWSAATLALPTPPEVHHRRRALVRRRQIVLALAALTAVALVAAIGSGSTAAWWALLAVVAAGSGYLGLLHHVRRVKAEREFAALFGPSDLDLLGWPGVTAPDPAPSRESQPLRTGRTGSQTWALGRFVLANLAGWALSPVVFALTLLLGERPRDTTGQRWLSNLQSAQDRLREQSLRTLAISAATTASVTAVGTVGALGATGVASAATAPTTASQPAGLGASYRVASGDTLGSIAARYGTTVAALAAVNHLTDPNLIFVGQVLHLGSGSTVGAPAPAQVSTTAAAPGGSTYRVVAGDTLGSIAARYGTTVANLVAINHLSDPNLIFVGEAITVDGSGAPAPAPSPRPAAAPAAAPAASPAAIAVQVALEQVGKPYQWAGAGPNSFDCSGLVMYAWAHAGVSLPHYSVAQYEDTTRISRSQLEPGDLVFYDSDGTDPGHVTMYIGNGLIVTADSPGTVIRVEVVDWDGIPMGYGRVR
jgi:cell wall-associated NlpC family hydrolase